MSQPPFTSPDAAEAAFYAAFEHGDAEAMMQVWAEDDEVVCIHPGGPRLVGRQAVRKSWQRILREGPRLALEVRVGHLHNAEGIATHVVDEQVTIANASDTHTVLATNVYRHTAEGWRMILHHASPAPAPRVPSDATVH